MITAGRLSAANSVDLAKLREVLPPEFFRDFSESPAAQHLDAEVLAEFKGEQWPGDDQAHIQNWWLVEGYVIGWNENPSGRSFPCYKLSPEEQAGLFKKALSHMNVRV